MKHSKFVIFCLALVIAFSAWFPTPVAAGGKRGNEEGGKKSTKSSLFVTVTLMNKTGGVLTLFLEGATSAYPTYVFNVGNNQKGSFVIKKGKYNVTLTSSACNGSFTPKWNLIGTKKKAVNMGTWICR